MNTMTDEQWNDLLLGSKVKIVKEDIKALSLHDPIVYACLRSYPQDTEESWNDAMMLTVCLLSRRVSMLTEQLTECIKMSPIIIKEEKL